MRAGKATPERGVPSPARMTLRLSGELAAALELAAAQTGLTVTALLIIAIWRSVLRHRYTAP